MQSPPILAYWIARIGGTWSIANAKAPRLDVTSEIAKLQAAIYRGDRAGASLQEKGICRMQTIPRRSSRSAWPELRTELRSRDLSIADLARSLGISYRTLSAYLVGYSPPPADLVHRIADALGIPAAQILPRAAREDRAIAEIRSRTERSPRLAKRTRQALAGEIPAADLEPLR